MLGACGGKDAVASEETEDQAFEDMREHVRSTVDDAAHEIEVLALVDQLQADFETLRSAIMTRRSKLRELNADYDTTRERFDEYIEQYDRQVKQSHQKFREARRAFISATTPDEWALMAKANTKSMAKLAKSLQSI